MPKSPSVQTTALDAFRVWMRAKGVSIFVLTVADRFGGEQMQECDRIIEHLTGFPGSAGALVVGLDGGALVVDGRYTAKARTIADALSLRVVEAGPNAVAQTLNHWLGSGEKWSAMADVVAHQDLTKLIAATQETGEFVPSLDAAIAPWWPSRAAETFRPVEVAGPALRQTSTKTKLASIWQRALAENPDVGCILVSDPAEVAWLLNVRGRDTHSLTTFRARALLQKRGKILLFGHQEHGMDAFHESHPSVTLQPEAELGAYLSTMKGLVQMCDASTPYALVEQVASKSRHLAPSPLKGLKAVKDPSEIQGMRDAHLADACAMARFLCWLESAVPGGDIDEYQAAQRLWQYRQAAGARMVSFDTISAVGSNAAFPHYRTTDATNRRLGLDQIYLVDSGGHYEAGTTDITRTLFFGNPPNEIVKHNTLVLMGHIDLARIKFPGGTTGHQLDSVARQHLWAHGFDYGHGTGHGVGAGLNVHEAPPTIAARHRGGSTAAFAPGMIVSNEPGYYQVDSHGIRIECLQICQSDPVAPNWLSFEVLSWVPIQRSLIDPTLMSHDQRAWLNAYHAGVLDRVVPLLTQQDDGKVIDWLRKACTQLPSN